MKGFGKFSLVVALPLVSLLLIVFCGTPAFAQQKYVLKFNHVLGQKEPYHQGFLNWAKAVETRTKGGLKIEVFHSAQLGVEEDILEQIRRGEHRAEHGFGPHGQLCARDRLPERPLFR